MVFWGGEVWLYGIKCMEKGSVVFGVTNRVFISIVIWSYIITDAIFHVRHVFK